VTNNIAACAAGTEATDPPASDDLTRAAEEANFRIMARPINPGVKVEANQEGVTFSAPDPSASSWEVRLADALGTRSSAAMETFMTQLSDLCSSTFDDSAGCLVPNERELNAVLAIVSGVRPDNEIQAALAAEMCAIHLMQMRVSRFALRADSVDSRSALLAGRLAPTFAVQAETLKKLQSKNAEHRQTFLVEKHVHQHQHLHLQGGEQQSGGQPQEPIVSTKRFHGGSPEHEGSPALPGAHEAGDLLSVSGRPRPGKVPHPWRG
jgi:hypothetical protein